VADGVEFAYVGGQNQKMLGPGTSLTYYAGPTDRFVVVDPRDVRVLLGRDDFVPV